jgi:hypothetical protein
MLSAQEQAEVDTQIALSKSLSLGFVFSLLPIAGLGSLAAIWIGARGWKKIEASGGKLVGTGMVLWCIAAGVAGLIWNGVFFWPMVLVIDEDRA